VDWEEFQKQLQTNLASLPPPTHINSQSELNTACSKLTKAVQDNIDAVVPTVVVTPNYVFGIWKTVRLKVKAGLL
jgi:hypothetical protein